MLVWESARGWAITGLALMVVQALFPLVTLYLVKMTIDAVTEGISAADKTAALQQIVILILATGGATLLSAACRAIGEVVREHQSLLVTDHVTDTIHRQSAAVDLTYYENSKYHDTFYRAQQEAPFRPNRIVTSLTQLAQNLISLLALGGLLFYLHWSIAVVLFIAVLPGVFVKIGHADRLFAWHARRTETERRAHDFHRMLTDLVHAREIRLFDLGGLFRKRYRMLKDTIRLERLDLAKKRAVLDMAAQAGAALSLFGMLTLIAWQTVRGVMTVGDMVMYYQAFQRAQRSLQEIMSGFAGLYEDNLFLNYFYGFLDLKPIVEKPAKAVAVPKPMRAGIKFENISFRYSGSDKDVLNGINLHIRPGEVVALVGENGAGKTTLAKLMCRLYEPSGGRITMDGIDIRSFDVQTFRREITMIFQDYIRYPMTARENIWIGDILLDLSDDRIKQAASQAGADKVISKLPDGEETMLGRRYEKGMEISIGEWQKIALARALLREAQLVILDEPTSAMSVRAEYEIFQRFKKLLSGRSALLISHRFSTVRMADRIFVMEDGKFAEQGSHEELMQLGERYARMFDMQARHYR